MTPAQQLLLACFTLIGLTLSVCLHMLNHRVKTMKLKRISPQSVALLAQRLSHFDDSRKSDNYNHLFELPVLFYVLCLMALITEHTPIWFIVASWCFVFSRMLHSWIQCTYNKVMHRFSVFVAGVFILISMWLGFGLTYFLS